VPPLRHVVIVLDSNEDTVNMLRIYLERSGFVVFGALTQLFRDGKLEFDRFVAEHQPRVIVYDVTVPYEQSWALFQYFRRRPVCRGVNFVLTTTNVARVEEIARPEQRVFEIVGKPYDLEQIVRAVKEAANERMIHDVAGDDRRVHERRMGPRDRRSETAQDRRGKSSG
jgi:DNA-binding NtrC family response regulator